MAPAELRSNVSAYVDPHLQGVKTARVDDCNIDPMVWTISQEGNHIREMMGHKGTSEECNI